MCFFFNAPATTEIYTLSLTTLFRSRGVGIGARGRRRRLGRRRGRGARRGDGDRKSTRLNSSHSSISYAVFCLKKKNVGADRAETQRFDHTTEVGPCVILC